MRFSFALKISPGPQRKLQKQFCQFFCFCKDILLQSSKTKSQTCKVVFCATVFACSNKAQLKLKKNIENLVAPSPHLFVKY